MSQKFSLLGKGVANNIANSIRHSGNLIGLVIRNFKAKLLLKSHNKLNSIQTVKTKLLKSSSWGNLIGIDLLKMLSNVNYTLSDGIPVKAMATVSAGDDVADRNESRLGNGNTEVPKDNSLKEARSRRKGHFY
mmetsp:Transcript_7048/g.13879  ORF Transcript_7048/g.13879 Transcript_7048/m.13879 type:complete len:133 (-) Transcript_7048:37-435(-)